MSTTITPPAEEQQIDSKAFIEQRNKEVQAVKEGKPAPVVEKPTAPAEEAKPEQPIKLPRSVRREMNRLREEAAEERGRRIAIEEFLKNGGKVAATEAPAAQEEDPKPKQGNYATEAEFNEANAAWIARQEHQKAEKAKEEKFQEEQWTAHLIAMANKKDEDSKKFADWDEVAESARENKEMPMLPKGQLDTLLKSSDMMAPILYYWAKHPAEMKKLVDMEEGPMLTKYFGRLETKVETLYSDQLEAAQASDKAKAESKDRTIPETRATAADRDVRKPRPSTEVAARGGSSAPAEPEIGSKAWMDLRNQATGGR